MIERPDIDGSTTTNLTSSGCSNKFSSLYDEASHTFENACSKSSIFNAEMESSIPRFNIAELSVGGVLGRGGFCVVNEVSSVKLIVEQEQQQNAPSKISDSNSECDYHHLQNRAYISENYLRDGQPRYAFKTLSPEILNGDDDDRIYKGIVDLAMEFKFLAVLQHPHIIKMRASSFNPCKPNFFVVVDRLSETLERRVFTWKKNSHSLCAILFDRLFNNSSSAKKLWLNRITVATDLASAFKYLHRHKIVYRDLKPENVGFDLRDDIKLFDFGLAKELHAEDKLPSGLYKLTGFTGSLRFMAPEVFKGEPYDFRADVYSFGILLWYTLALEVPYANFNYNMYERIIVGQGLRPKLLTSWPESIKTLLQNCWSTKISDRPTFDEICDILKKEIMNASDENGELELDISNKTEISLRDK